MIIGRNYTVPRFLKQQQMFSTCHKKSLGLSFSIAWCCSVLVLSVHVGFVLHTLSSSACQ